MGAFIETDYDFEIKSKLDRRFTAGLKRLRKALQTDPGLFDGQHRDLRRIAWRLRGYPNDHLHRRRWFHILHEIKSDAALRDRLLSGLLKAVQDYDSIDNQTKGCVGATFNQQPNTAARGDYDIQFSPDPAPSHGTYVLSVVLLVKQNLPAGNYPGEPLEPAKDPPEQGDPQPPDT